MFPRKLPIAGVALSVQPTRMSKKMENSVEVQRREVLEFDLGVCVYPPAAAGGYWRVRWERAATPP